MKYLKGLDTLRAFAVIFVVITHWWIPMDINESTKNIVYWIHALLPDGGFGVDVFFVLSGFLITSILLDATKNNIGSNFTIIKNFIVRRALRIFPLYYALILILFLVGYPFEKGSLVWYLTYAGNVLAFHTHSWNNFGHTWSLSVEEQFYLIWPWFIIFVNEKYLKFVFVAAILVGLISTVYIMKIQELWAGSMLMPCCMQSFGIGGLYAYLYKTSSSKILFRCINILFPIALVCHFYLSFSSHEVDELFYYSHRTLNSIISIWLIHRIIHNKSEWIKNYILENRVLNKIGQVSYGIYLFHYVMPFAYEIYVPRFFDRSQSVGAFLMDWKNAYYIRLVLLVILSLSSFYFFEKPIMKLKSYFEY